MTKNEFLDLLDKNLKDKKFSERTDYLQYYEDIIDGKIEGGMDEEEVINSFKSIDEIADDIIAQSNDIFELTFSEIINESNIQDKDLLLSSPKIINKDYEHNLLIDKPYKIKTKTWKRNIIIDSSTSSGLKINYNKSIIFPITVKHSKDNDNIEILESSYGIWLNILVQTLLFGALYLVFYLILRKPLISKSGYWHFLVFTCASIGNLIINLIFNHKKEHNNLKIIVPNNSVIKEFEVTSVSSNITISNIVSKELTGKIYSGKLNINNTYANIMNYKLSSGKLSLENDSTVKSIDSLNIYSHSGNAKVTRVNVNEFFSKINSGSLIIKNMGIDKINFKSRSGRITTQNIICKNDAYFKISSGSFKINDKKQVQIKLIMGMN